MVAAQQPAPPTLPLLVVVGLVGHGTDEAGVPTYVVTRRPANVHLAHRWELPGGKVERGERPERALVRELQEELGVQVASWRPITFSHHVYPERAVLILFYAVELASGAVPKPLAASELKLVTAAELAKLDMPAANAPLVEWLEERL